jgi:hypothetical protein
VVYSTSGNTVTLGLAHGSLHIGEQVVISWKDLRDIQNRSFSGRAGPITAR